MPQDWFEQNKPVRRNYIPTQVEEEDDWFAKNRPEPTPPPAPVKRVNTSTEPTTLDKWVSGGLRTIPAVVGGVVGGTATGAATMGVGTLAGGSIGGAAGAGIGEGLAEWYEKVRGIRKEFNPAQVAVQTGVGAIPFLGKFPGAGATWGQIGKYAGRAALEGGVVNAAATVPTQLAETGELPSLPQVGEAGVMGGVMGGALGGGFAAYPKIRTKGIDPTALPAGKPNVKVVPDVDTSVVPPSGPPPTAPANGQPKSRVPSVATIQKRLGVSVEEATSIRDKIKSSIDMGVNPPVAPQAAAPVQQVPSIPPTPIQQPPVIPQQAQPLPPVTPIAQAPPTPKQKVVDAFEKAKQKVRALPSVEAPVEPVKQPEVPPAPSETGFQVLLKKDGKYWVESPTLRRPSGPFNSDYLANKWVEANLNAPQVEAPLPVEKPIRELPKVETNVVPKEAVKTLPTVEPITQPKVEQPQPKVEQPTFKIRDKAGNVAPIPADEFEGLTPRLRIIVEDFNANGMDIAKTAKSLGISEANLQASLDSVRSITNVLPTNEGAVLTSPKTPKAKAEPTGPKLFTTEPKKGKPGSTQRLAYVSWAHGQTVKEKVAKLAKIKGMPPEQVDWERDWATKTEIRSIAEAEANIEHFRQREITAAENYEKAVQAARSAKAAATPEVDTSVVPKQVVKELPPVEQPKTEEPVNPHAETIKKHEATRSLSERYRAIVAEMDATGAKDVEYRDVLSTGGKAELKKGETWRGRVLKFADMADIANKRMNLPEVETSVVPKEVVKELPKVESPIEAKPEPIEGESAVDFIKRTLNVPIEQFQKIPKDVQQQVLKEWRKGQDTFRGPDIEPKEMAVRPNEDPFERMERKAREKAEAEYIQKVWDGQSEVRLGADGNDVIHINKPGSYLSPESKAIVEHSPAFKKMGSALRQATNIILDAIERPLADPTDKIGKEMFLIRKRLKRLGFAFTHPSGEQWGVNVSNPRVNFAEHKKIKSIEKMFREMDIDLDTIYQKLNYEFGAFIDLPYMTQLSKGRPDSFIADVINTLEHELAHNIIRDEMSYSHGVRMAAIRRLSADKLPEIIDTLRKGFFDANGQHFPELLEVLQQVKAVPWIPNSNEFFIPGARIGKEGPSNIKGRQGGIEPSIGESKASSVETKEAYVSRVTGLTKEQFNKLPNRTRTAVLAGYGASGGGNKPPTSPKKTESGEPPIPPKKKGVEPATIVGKVGRIFYKKFMEANPKFKEITDRLIKRRSASEIIGKQVRDEFKDEIGHISKDEIVPFQEDVEAGKYPRVREFFDNLHALLESKGAKVGYKENYLPQMWDNTPEEVAAVFGNKTMREKASFQFRSFIDDYAEGIEKGLKPKMKPLELMDWYAQRVNKLIADRAALKSLRKQGYLVQAKNRTSGMQKIESKYGSFEGYYADPSVKAVLENYLGSQEKVGGGIGQALARFSGKMTNLALSSGLVPNKPLFTAHGANMAFPFMSRSFMEGGIKRNLKALKYAWSPEAAGKYLDENAKKAEYLTKRWGYRGQVENPSPGGNLFENTEGIFGKGKEAANKLSELQAKYFEKPLFDKTIPATKLEATWDNFQRNLKKGMTEDEAGKAAVKIGDSFYSGRNLDLMYHNKNFNTFAKIAMAAPDWFRSTVDLGINVPKSMVKILSNPKDPLTQAYAKAGGRMLAIYAAANLAQKAATGKFMWENSTSDQFTMKLGKDVENKKTRGLKIFNNAGDFFKIPMQIAKATVEEGGGAEVLESSLEGRGSPLTHAALAVASGEDYKGEKNIVGTRDRYGRQVPTAERLRNTLSQTINFGPPQAAAPYNYATGRMTGEEAIARVAEAPLKYGKKKKNPFAFEPFTPVPSNRRGKSVWDYGR